MTDRNLECPFGSLHDLISNISGVHCTNVLGDHLECSVTIDLYNSGLNLYSDTLWDQLTARRLENGAPGLSRCISGLEHGGFPASHAVSLPEGNSG